MPNYDAIINEVMYLPLSSCSKLTDLSQRPNQHLMQLFTSLTLAEIDGVFLSTEVEEPISTVLAAATLHNVWNDNDISTNYFHENQRAYNALLSMTIKIGHEPIATASKYIVEMPNIKSCHKAWDAFCTSLVQSAKVRLLEIEYLFWEVRKTDNNASSKLLDFVLHEHEED